MRDARNESNSSECIERKREREKGEKVTLEINVDTLWLYIFIWNLDCFKIWEALLKALLVYNVTWWAFFPLGFYCHTFRFSSRVGSGLSLSLPFCFSRLSISYYNQFIKFIVLRVFVCAICITWSIAPKIPLQTKIVNTKQLNIRKFRLQNIYETFDTQKTHTTAEAKEPREEKSNRKN